MVVLIQPCLEGSDISDSIATPTQSELFDDGFKEEDTVHVEGVCRNHVQILRRDVYETETLSIEHCSLRMIL